MQRGVLRRPDPSHREGMTENPRTDADREDAPDGAIDDTTTDAAGATDPSASAQAFDPADAGPQAAGDEDLDRARAEIQVLGRSKSGKGRGGRAGGAAAIDRAGMRHEPVINEAEIAPSNCAKGITVNNDLV